MQCNFNGGDNMIETLILAVICFIIVDQVTSKTDDDDEDDED